MYIVLSINLSIFYKRLKGGVVVKIEKLFFKFSLVNYFFKYNNKGKLC